MHLVEDGVRRESTVLLDHLCPAGGNSGTGFQRKHGRIRTPPAECCPVMPSEHGGEIETTRVEKLQEEDMKWQVWKSTYFVV
jgi:hypothetical protein